MSGKLESKALSNIRITGVPVEIQAKNLTNTSLEHYHYAIRFGTFNEILCLSNSSQNRTQISDTLHAILHASRA
jgi:hypothetical protein